MASHTIRQFDELPAWTVKVGWDTAEGSWPALPGDAKVTMIARKDTTTPWTAPTVVVDATTRTVRWDPTSAQTAVSGVHRVVWRITYSNGKSQTHPETGSDTLTIEPAIASTDVADPT